MTAAVIEIDDAGEAVRPTARLGRYAVWQLRDYAFGVGGATLVLGGLGIGVLAMMKLSVNGTAPAAVGMTTGVLGVLGFLGPIFACSGLVADDRSRGYYRFTLAKPVNPVRLYGQAFLLRWAAFLAIMAVVWVVGAVLLAPPAFIGTLAYAALCYLTIGGVTLLLSTMLRHAWIGSLILAAASAITTGLARVPGLWWLKAVHAILPPFWVVGDIASATMRGMLPPTGEVAWFVAYGLLAILAALVVIRGREWPL